MSFPPESRYGWLPSSFRCQRSRCVLACDVQALYLVYNVQLWFSRILTGQFQKCGQWEWRQPFIESENLKDPCQRTRLDFLSHIPFQIRLEGAAEFDLPAFTIIYLSIHEKAAPDFRELLCLCCNSLGETAVGFHASNCTASTSLSSW